MSNAALTWAFAQALPTGPKFVLVVLADFADERGSCFPGQLKIGSMTGMSRSTVSRHIADLTELGYITVEARYRDGHRTSSRYVLDMRTQAVGKDVDNPMSRNLIRMDLDVHTSQSATAEPSLTPSKTPNPADAGNTCPAHPNRPAPNCRGCRTNPRALRAAKRAERPDWCGHCDDQTRLTLDDTPRRCPACHPLAVGAP